LHRPVHPTRALVHEIVPLAHSLLRVLEKAAVGIPAEERQQSPERATAVPYQPDLDRIAEADSHGIQLGLDGARLVWLWIELDVGERRADEEQRIAGLERLLRRPSSEQADRAGRVHAVVRYRAFSEQRLDDGCAQHLRRRLELVGRGERAS